MRLPTEPPRGDADPTDLEELGVTEQQEAAWLLARELDVNAPPPSPQVAEEYAALEDLLAHLPVAERDNSWHSDVLRLAVQAEQSPKEVPAALPPPLRRRARTKWIAAGGLAGLTSAAAAVLFLVRAAPLAAFQLADKTVASRDLRGGENESPAVGKQHHWTLKAPADGLGNTELRVFDGDGDLVGLCAERTTPDVAQCTSSGGGTFDLFVELRHSGRYTAYVVTGANALPLELSREDFLAALQDRAETLKLEQSGEVPVPR
jgi:hypothetical protein